MVEMTRRRACVSPAGPVLAVSLALCACTAAANYARHDGSNNNLANPTWNAAGTTFMPKPVYYADSISSVSAQTEEHEDAYIFGRMCGDKHGLPCIIIINICYSLSCPAKITRGMSEHLRVPACVGHCSTRACARAGKGPATGGVSLATWLQ